MDVHEATIDMLGSTQDTRLIGPVQEFRSDSVLSTFRTIEFYYFLNFPIMNNHTATVQGAAHTISKCFDRHYFIGSPTFLSLSMDGEIGAGKDEMT